MKKEKKEDENILFRCMCGHYGFLEVSIFEWEKEPTEYIITFIDEPVGFWQKLKWLFKGERYVNSIVLTKKEMKKLAELLNRHI